MCFIKVWGKNLHGNGGNIVFLMFMRVCSGVNGGELLPRLHETDTDTRIWGKRK